MSHESHLYRDRIGCGDIDHATQAFDAGLIGKEQLAVDALIYHARQRKPKLDAAYRRFGK